MNPWDPTEGTHEYEPGAHTRWDRVAIADGAQHVLDALELEPRDLMVAVSGHPVLAHVLHCLGARALYLSDDDALNALLSTELPGPSYIGSVEPPKRQGAARMGVHRVRVLAEVRAGRLPRRLGAWDVLFTRVADDLPGALDLLKDTGAAVWIGDLPAPAVPDGWAADETDAAVIWRRVAQTAQHGES